MVRTQKRNKLLSNWFFMKNKVPNFKQVPKFDLYCDYNIKDNIISFILVHETPISHTRLNLNANHFFTSTTLHVCWASNMMSNIASEEVNNGCRVHIVVLITAAWALYKPTD